MALLPDPRVLLLDEPFEAIDPSSSRAIQNLLTRSGATVLLTSHMLPTVARVASRVLIMRQGKLVLDTTATDRLEEAWFECFEQS
jgi:ABC-2 type transport system ATP-binding protein